MITSIVDYEGTKQKSVSITKGYGANEIRESKVMNYDEFEEFVSDLETKQKIKVMENENVKTKQDSKGNLKELRDILFETLRGVKDGTVKADKAKIISEVSQVLINSAKVEIDYIRATGNNKKSNMME